MDVGKWAEIKRLFEVEKLSRRKIGARLRCSRRTINKALATEAPPSKEKRRTASRLDPYKERIRRVIAEHPACPPCGSGRRSRRRDSPAKSRS